MAERTDPVKLQDGTLVRHKVAVYEGRIDGTTGIKACFTLHGELLHKPSTKETFQYRVVIKGETMRRIAPVEDLEILEGVAEVVCPSCHTTFQSKPGYADKPRGRCQCGGWICPSCLACQAPKEKMGKSGQAPKEKMGKSGQAPKEKMGKSGQAPCAKQRRRQASKLAPKRAKKG